MATQVSPAFGSARANSRRALLQRRLLFGENGVACLIHNLNDTTNIAQGFYGEPIHQLVSPIQRNVADKEGQKLAHNDQLHRSWTVLGLDLTDHESGQSTYPMPLMASTKLWL